MWLPNRIYKYTPYVFIATGLWVAIRLEPLVGRLSGLVLIAAGVLILVWRWQARPPSIKAK